jgi:hypothetical protein
MLCAKELRSLDYGCYFPGYLQVKIQYNYQVQSLNLIIGRITFRIQVIHLLLLKNHTATRLVENSTVVIFRSFPIGKNRSLC